MPVPVLELHIPFRQHRGGARGGVQGLHGHVESGRLQPGLEQRSYHVADAELNEVEQDDLFAVVAGLIHQALGLLDVVLVVLGRDGPAEWSAAGPEGVAQRPQVGRSGDGGHHLLGVDDRRYGLPQLPSFGRVVERRVQLLEPEIGLAARLREVKLYVGDLEKPGVEVGVYRVQEVHLTVGEGGYAHFLVGNFDGLQHVEVGYLGAGRAVALLFAGHVVFKLLHHQLVGDRPLGEFVRAGTDVSDYRLTARNHRLVEGMDDRDGAVALAERGDKDTVGFAELEHHRLVVHLARPGQGGVDERPVWVRGAPAVERGEHVLDGDGPPVVEGLVVAKGQHEALSAVLHGPAIERLRV